MRAPSDPSDWFNVFCAVAAVISFSIAIACAAISKGGAMSAAAVGAGAIALIVSVASLTSQAHR